MAAGVMAVVADCAELFAGSRSDSLAMTVAVLRRFPSKVGAATIVAEAPPLTGRLPTFHATSPPAEPAMEPWDNEADTKLTPAGRTFVTMTPVAAEGPRLATVIVLVMLVPPM